MVTVSVRFLAGRFHATPWGRHVNEGVPEWPPAPWRLLRALLAVWKRKHPGVTEERISDLLAPLREPPLYSLPPATAGHLRYFQPWEKKGPRDRTFIIDTFVAVRREDPLLIGWPEVELDADQRELLDQLLEGLGYLGRSESWCSAEVEEDWKLEEGTLRSKRDGETRSFNCRPINKAQGESDGPAASAQTEVVSVLGVHRAATVGDLLVRTGDLRSSNRDPNHPPGSKWLDYERPGDCLEVTPTDRAPTVTTSVQPTVVRWAFDSSVLPRVTDTVEWAGVARAAAMSAYGCVHDGGASPLLAGKGPDGEPLTGHQHAFYLPTDEDLDGRLDHLTIWVPGGLDRNERRALGTLSKLYPEGGTPEIGLLQEGVGNAVDFSASLYLGQHRQWQSVTPFVLYRHPKRRNDGSPRRDKSGRWIDGPEDQLRRACRQRKIPEPAGIEPEEACQLPGTKVRWTEFRRWRKRGPDPARAEGYGFQLQFDEPVAGPLSLGYASHFGLGLFRKVE